MAARELTCREFADFLMAYDDGELPQDERIVFDAHLALCPDCVAYLQSYRATVALGRRAFAGRDEDAAGREAPERLVQAILAARRRRTPA